MKNLLFIAFAVVFISSCEKFIDKRDPTATSFDEFYNTEEDLRRVVYSSYTDVFTNRTERKLLFYMIDGRSDNAYSRVKGDYHQEIANGSMNSNSQLAAYYWELHNKHLGRLNEFIDNADIPYVDDEAVREKYRNILRGLRVWHYFVLTFHWGDVPFKLEPADLEEAIQPPFPKETILDSLFKISEDIAANLPPDEYVSDKFMLNRYSFKALVMRYALYNERYDLAASLAKEIIESNHYELYPVYGDLFNYNADKTNKEFIITMDMESHSGNTNSFRDLAPQYKTGNGQSYVVPAKSLVDAYWTLQGDPIDQSSQHSKEEYEVDPKLNRDPRYEASIFGNGDVFAGEDIDIYDQNNPMYYQNERSSKTGYWFKKFVDESDAFKADGNMYFPLFRYAEVLLSYAEAKIMLDEVDQLAIDCINQIRERAGLDMDHARVSLADGRSKEEWIKLIRNERRIELAGEGLRYDDIIRWKIAEDVLTKPVLGDTRLVNGELRSLKVEDRSFSSHQYMWPFHESTLRVEPELVQNPGY